MKLLCTSFLLLLTCCCFSQKRNVYYFKNDGAYLPSVDSADYTRVVTEPDSGSNLYNVQEYYKNGKRKLVVKSSAIDPPRYEGQCIAFDRNGKRKSIVQYKNGEPVGDESYFFPNGRIFKVITYPDKIDPNADFDNSYSFKESYDSVGTAMVVNGNGYLKGYAADSTETYEEGQVKDGKRDGIWKGNVKELHVAFTENYINGVLVSGIATYDDNQTATYTRKRRQETGFQGTTNGFTMFLLRNVRYPTTARERSIQGRVIVGFVVEETGKISHVKINRSAARSLDAEAVRVLNSSPPWTPAFRFGRPVKRTYAVPIDFMIR